MTDSAAPLGYELDERARAPRAIDLAAAGQRNQRLQLLRGIAALSVVLYHASQYLFDLRGDALFLPVFGGFWGGYGVAIFFALSGYLMADVLERDAPGRFLVSRIARIYPLMLIVVGLAAAGFLLIGKPRGLNLLSLTLVPSGPRGYFLGVEWTLLYEMTYYAGLSLLGFLGLARFRSGLMLVWLAVLAIAYVMGPGRGMQGLPMLSEIPLSIVNLPFVLGYLTFTAHKRGWLPPYLIVPAAVVALAIPFAPSHFLLLVGLSAGLLLAASVRAAPAVHAGTLGRFGLKLGDASFALYLCHIPVILILAGLTGEALPPPLLWLLWVGAAIAVALALAPLDLFIHRRLKQVINAASPARLKVIGLFFLAAFIGIAVHTERDARADAAGLARAERILGQEPVLAGSEVSAAIDAVEQLPNGAWVVRGYGIDLLQPGLEAHFAVRQNNKVLVVTGMRRMRVATARALGRPELESLRFGFMVFLPKDLDCAKGPLEGILVLEDGRSTVIPSEPLAAVCR